MREQKFRVNYHAIMHAQPAELGAEQQSPPGDLLYRKEANVLELQVMNCPFSDMNVMLKRSPDIPYHFFLAVKPFTSSLNPKKKLNTFLPRKENKELPPLLL